MANKKHKNADKPFKWKHADGGMILWLVTWYCRYALSYRDLKEIAAWRGLEIDRSTLCRWVQEYSPEINKCIGQHGLPENEYHVHLIFLITLINPYIIILYKKISPYKNINLI